MPSAKAAQASAVRRMRRAMSGVGVAAARIARSQWSVQDLRSHLGDRHDVEQQRERAQRERDRDGARASALNAGSPVRRRRTWTESAIMAKPPMIETIA